MTEANSKQENRNNKWWIWIIAIIVAVVVFMPSNNGNESDSYKQTATVSEDENDISNDNYFDALRKCTVMEAADLYATGGQKSNNVFNDARETCEEFYKNESEDEFFEAIRIDWGNRKSETIEGENLEYYLNELGW